MIAATAPTEHTRDGLAFPQTVTPNTPKGAAPQGIFHPFRHRWLNLVGHLPYGDCIRAQYYKERADRQIAKFNAIAIALGAGKQSKKK